MTPPTRPRRGAVFHTCLVVVTALFSTIGADCGRAAGNVTLQNIAFQIADTSYRMPRIEFVGVNLGQQQLSALFDPRAREPLPARIATLSANAVNVPELVVEWSLSNGRQSATIRGLSLQNVTAGKAASVSISAVRSEGALIDLATIGPIAITDLDLALAARLHDERSGPIDKDQDAVVGAIDFNVIDVRTKSGSTVHTDRMSVSSMRALPAAPKEPDGRPDASDAQRYLSGVGTVSLAGVRADLVAGDSGNEPLKLSLKSASLTSEHPYNGLPTDIGFTIDDLKILLPSNSDASAIRDLRELGYDTIDLSLQMSASWNEAKSEVVSDVAVRLGNAGSVALRATIGNVGKDAFSSTPAVAEAASSKATVKLLAISFNNDGLFDKLLASEARKQRRPADDIRKDFLSEAEAVIVTMLGTSPDVATVRKAIADFINHPGELEIAIKVKAPGGIAWTDVVAAAALPAELLDKLYITARAK
jgi:hypothetical protein